MELAAHSAGDGPTKSRGYPSLSRWLFAEAGIMGHLRTLGWVALMVVLIAAVAPGTTPALGQSPASDADLEQLVRDFYGAVEQRRYPEAYAYLSRVAQEQEPYADFVQGFDGVVYVAVRSVEGVAVEGATASVVVHLAASSKGQPPGIAACSRVEWRLVLEDGAWKREGITPITEDCDAG